MNDCKLLLLRRKLKQNTELIKEFINQNSPNELLKQISSHPIDEVRKERYINGHKDKNIQDTLRSLINDITYITKDMFNLKMKELCDVYNQNKTNNDIYILLFIPANFITYFSKNIYLKSNFFTTLLSGYYLNYDYILDLTTKDEYNKINTYLDTIRKENPNKNIFLYFSDDCVYSGTQLNEILSKLSEKLISKNISINKDIHKYIQQINKNNIYNKTEILIIHSLLKKIFYYKTYKTSIRLICPFILKPYDYYCEEAILLNEIKNDVSIGNNFEYDTRKIDKYLNNIVINDKKYNKYYYFNLFDISLIKDKIKNNIQNIKTTDLMEQSKKYLLYFDFKIADDVSVNQVVLFGRIIYDYKKYYDNFSIETNFKQDEVLKINKQFYYPIIKNCYNYLKNKIKTGDVSGYECPDKLYENFLYNFNNKEINFTDKTYVLLTNILRENN